MAAIGRREVEAGADHRQVRSVATSIAWVDIYKQSRSCFGTVTGPQFVAVGAVVGAEVKR